MNKFPSQEMDRFNVRLPVGMRDAIAERAKKNGRSMNSEIVQILEDALFTHPVRVTSEFNIDLHSEIPGGDDKITMPKKQFLEMVDKSVQQAIEAAAEDMAIKMAEATLDSLSERFDFVPKNKKPT
ncbi:Arc family DNA-binding protein [Atlantibacter hermannii]|uniref:Arc family DNA-binding protein n=1 Tax=Atlantibacter hermannii TaxID=565 RepID=UPI0015FBADC3|nr:MULTISPECIES: Arc family DNA-binding protein [Enterobacteriaceae]MBA8034732.1 Arc family DNA-binding protein [Citrobacter freundii]MDQ2230670.1 Arc family DNA-binding protein [Citrobacter portucalensis]HEE9886339.1 Arc family DNA-binding protein [Citrobacter braakii]